MSPEATTETGASVMDVLFGQLLRRGVQYFLPSCQLAIVGQETDATPEFVVHGTSGDGLNFGWLGNRYILSSSKQFSDHEQTMLRSIGKFLSRRYRVLFDTEVAAQNLAILSGLPEDRYVSAFLDASVFDDDGSGPTPDRISMAIDVLRISALSSYEDKRISTGALLFGSLPDACHPLPPLPADALPYSSELTAIRSFHRICDGLRTLALVDRGGLMVELVDVEEWAHPFSAIELPVPSARRYRTHCQATMCGGHLCLVLTPNGEIKVFGDGVQLFSFLDGRWHLTDAVSKYQAWETAIGNRELSSRLFSAALNLAEQRRGGMFVVLDDGHKVRQLVSGLDLLESDRPERAGAKSQLHYLLRRQLVTGLSPVVLESIAQIDGSVVLDRDANLLAFGAILRHLLPMAQDEEIGEGGRTAAAISASQFGHVLMVSEGGQCSFYQNGHSIWTL